MRLALLLRRGLELNEVIDAKDRDRSFRREPHGETPRSGKGVHCVKFVKFVKFVKCVKCVKFVKCVIVSNVSNFLAKFGFDTAENEPVKFARSRTCV